VPILYRHHADTDDHKRPSRPVEADFRISLTVTMCDMMTKFAPVPDFKIVCTPTQMIIKDLLDQSRLIQLL